tara:strand:- start:491 stop:637 length:147 start_codon:yes stop_codon:yes gene_type:complete
MMWNFTLKTPVLFIFGQPHGWVILIWGLMEKGWKKYEEILGAVKVFSA